MYLIFVFAIVMHILSVLITLDFGFTNELTINVIALSTIDLLLNYLVVMTVCYKSPLFFQQGAVIYNKLYRPFFENNKLIILIFVGIAAHQAVETFDLILSGIERHQLIQEYDRGGVIYMLVSGLFKMLFPIVFYFGASKRVKLLSTLGLVFTIMITASRSELMYVINFYIILMLFKTDRNQLLRGGIVALTMVLAAISVTIVLQNRPISEGLMAVVDMGRSVFQYRAYSYYLAELSLQIASSFDKVLFPFFGYISEFVIKTVSSSPTPIGSEFVGTLHYLGDSPITGRPYLANVLYPWWSWFVGTFGPLGLIIKALYCFVLLTLCVGKRMLFTTVILMSFIILGTTSAHPFLTLTHTIAVASCVIIDIVILSYAKYKLKV